MKFSNGCCAAIKFGFPAVFSLPPNSVGMGPHGGLSPTFLFNIFREVSGDHDQGLIKTLNGIEL